MNALPTWSVRNRVAVNIFTIALLIAGAVAGFTKITRAIFPDVNTNFIRVITVDPTTSVPEDIERVITVPIEEELADVQGVKKIVSYSQDNVSTVFMELEADITDVDPVLNEVRQAVDKAKADLPSSAEVPIVEKFDIPLPLVTLTVAYPPTFDIREARSVLDRLERRLRVVPGVSDVLVDGLQDKEVWIEVDPYKMEGLGISFAQLADIVRRKNLNTVGGKIDAAGGERIVRVLGEIRQASELESLPIKEDKGQLVVLRDIATIKATSEEEQTRGRVNLRPAITFTIVKRKGADAVDVVKRVRKVFAEESKQLPKSFETQVTSDSTKYINTRIETVLKNGTQALLLVSLLLVLFLNWRLGVIVAIGLPVSFAGTFVVLYLGGYTINLLSLFGMIMALGMVVDDAIVISENSFRYLEAGLPPVKAAIRGAGEVIWPVLGSVSTTVAAFLPLMLAEGIIGKFLVIVPIVVVSTLTFSLIQAFLVLPSHFADFVRRVESIESLERRLETARGVFPRFRIQAGLVYKEMRAFLNRTLDTVSSVYMHLLNISLRRRYWVIAGFVASLFAVGGAMALGVVKFQLFAADFADRILVKLDLPSDASLDETEAAVEEVEDAIVRGVPQSDLVALVTRVGGRLDPTNQFLVYGTNLAMITVDIDEQNPDCRKPSVIQRDLNAILRRFPRFTKATAEVEGGGPPVGRAINVELRGDDLDTLQKMAADVQARVSKLEGVQNIGTDFDRGKTEYRVIVDEAKAARAGLDVSMVGQALQGGFLGLEAAKLRWGNDEVTIRVKMEDRFTRDPELLRGFRIRNRDGRMVDLGSVASLVRTNGIARIKRQNQERMITVSGDIDDRVTTSKQANEKIREWIPELKDKYPGYEIALAGENEDTERSLESMKFAALVALLLIYTLLATISNSFLQPLVIMSVIPFGVVGVVLGLIIMGEPLGLMSMMGTIALAGIVVNNSVVFVDFINQYRKQYAHGGDETGTVHAERMSPLVRWRSVMASGRTRFRPIFLTSATTVAGLMGLAFTTSGQEQFLAPMAQAIVFGLTFATVITMILIPCLYSILDDFTRAVTRIFARPQVERAHSTASVQG